MGELDPGKRVAVPYIERQLVGDGGASDAYGHDGWIEHLTVEAIAVVTEAEVTVTVTFEHSDDGENWDEIDHADFVAGTGTATFGVDAPKQYTRLSWTIDDADLHATVEAEGLAEAITAGQLGSRLVELGSRLRVVNLAAGETWSFDDLAPNEVILVLDTSGGGGPTSFFAKDADGVALDGPSLDGFVSD